MNGLLAIATRGTLREARSESAPRMASQQRRHKKHQRRNPHCAPAIQKKTRQCARAKKVTADSSTQSSLRFFFTRGSAFVHTWEAAQEALLIWSCVSTARRQDNSMGGSFWVCPWASYIPALSLGGCPWLLMRRRVSRGFGTQ